MRIIGWLSRGLLYPAGVGLAAAAPLLASGLWHAPRWLYAVVFAILGTGMILASFGVLRLPGLERLTGVEQQ